MSHNTVSDPMFEKNKDILAATNCLLCVTMPVVCMNIEGTNGCYTENKPGFSPRIDRDNIIICNDFLPT